ncbi:MAG: hypothetical protein LBN95_14180, partial [Prevotellaceae bacterium]|nr:hypothetical protein [Prevotellaceae bacterium]
TKTFFGKKAFSPDDFIKIQNAKIIYGKNENVLFAVLLQITCFALLFLLPIAFAAGLWAFIIAAGLYQFYHSPSNSVVKLLFSMKFARK